MGGKRIIYRKGFLYPLKLVRGRIVVGGNRHAASSFTGSRMVFTRVRARPAA